MRGGMHRWRWMAGVLMLALGLSACTSTPDVRRDGALVRYSETAPALPVGRLALPARIGLLRIVDGRVTPVPAIERTLWAGAFHEVNRQFTATMRLAPLPAVPTPMRPVPGDPEGRSIPETQLAIEAALAIAQRTRLEGVMIYEISSRAERDPLVAGIAELPLFGGVVPRTVYTEGHGTAVAILVEPTTRALAGFATARMADAPIVSVRNSRGRAEPLRELTDYAVLNRLTPRAEDMLINAVAYGL